MSDESTNKATLALLAMIHEELIAIRTQVRYLQTMQRAQEPRLTRGLAEFAGFDWSTIGATVLEEDEDGPALVQHGPHRYTRRSGAGKYGQAIWFSRYVGNNDDGTKKYHRLVTFKDYDRAEALPSQVAEALPEETPAASGNSAPAADPELEDPEHLFSFKYADGSDVDRSNTAELDSYNEYRRAHGDKPPADRASLRKWYRANGRKAKATS